MNNCLRKNKVKPKKEKKIEDMKLFAQRVSDAQRDAVAQRTTHT